MNATDKTVTTEAYVKPEIEVIAVDNEGILASSAGKFGDGSGYNGW